jgi:hypothetical protein
MDTVRDGCCVELWQLRLERSPACTCRPPHSSRALLYALGQSRRTARIRARRTGPGDRFRGAFRPQALAILQSDFVQRHEGNDRLTLGSRLRLRAAIGPTSRHRPISTGLQMMRAPRQPLLGHQCNGVV